jgi:hypothetical protein
VFAGILNEMPALSPRIPNPTEGLRACQDLTDRVLDTLRNGIERRLVEARTIYAARRVQRRTMSTALMRVHGLAARQAVTSAMATLAQPTSAITIGSTGRMP